MNSINAGFRSYIRSYTARVLLLALPVLFSGACLNFEESDFDATGVAILWPLLFAAGDAFALGQPNTTTVSGIHQGMQRPEYVLVVGNKLIVSDNRLKRILIYNTIPNTTGAIPDVAIGQADVHTGGIQAVPLPMNALYINDPKHIATDGTRLAVVDQSSHRVLIWNTIPTTNLTPADVVVGQSDFTSSSTGSSATLMNQPTGVAICGGRLYISDTTNNRVLGYNSIPGTNGTPADFVIGQANTTANGGGAGSAGMSLPTGITCTGTEMYIADGGNNRVLYYMTLPIATNANANQVTGQTGFAGTGSGTAANQLFGPGDVHVDAVNDRLYVADTRNNRVLLYSPRPMGTNAFAVSVLGQNAFGVATANNTSLANGMEEPIGVFADANNVYVASRLNHRIMVWNSLAPATFAAVSHVVGQPSTTTALEYYAGASLSMMRQVVDVASNGSSLFAASDINNRVLNWTTLPGATADAHSVLGQPNTVSIAQNNPSIGAATLNFPAGVCATSTHLYVADGRNHRILVYTPVPTTDSAGANFVLGQANFTANLANAGGIVAQNAFSTPGRMYCDATRLVVADSANHRILIWNSPPTVTMQNADVVVGQSNFGAAGAGASTLDSPGGVLIAEGKLIVADSNQHRVLIWNTVPTTNGVGPDIVLGQTNFTNIGLNANGAGVSARSFYSPGGLAYYNGALMVADGFNHRILIYRSIPTADHTAADLVFGRTDFTSNIANGSGVSGTSLNVPFGLTAQNRHLYIADAFNHRVLAVPLSSLGL